MDIILRDDKSFHVDATVIGAGFRIDPSLVPELMRAGRITSRCEEGQDEDAGRWRLTFFHQGRALRLTVDTEGQIISRAIFDAPRRPG